MVLALPDTTLKIIFSYLDFDQLLMIRTGSEKFSSLIDQIIEDKPLWIKKSKDNSNYFRFFCINKTYQNYQFNISYSTLLFRISDQIHSKIIKLIVYNPLILIDLKLDNLVHLEIKNDKKISKYNSEESEHSLEDEIHDKSFSVNLKFMKLKTLSIDIKTTINFMIEANNLVQLKILNNIEKVNILNPKTVKTLYTYELSEKINHFKNVSKLFIDILIYCNLNNTNVLKHLSKLRELQISKATPKSLEKLIEDQKEIYPKLKIFYKNVDVNDVQFKFYVVDEIDKLCLTNKHYSTFLLYFNSLKGEFKQTTLILNKPLVSINDPDLISRFVNIRFFRVDTNLIPYNDWVKILSSLKLEKIDIDQEYDQLYLNILPKYCPHLKCLLIKNYENLDFLFNLNYLERLTLSNLLSIDLFKKLVENLTRIRSIRMNLNLNASYRFEMTEETILLVQNNKKTFYESKHNFLNSTAHMNTWTELFNMNGNAICEFEN